jgi:hypothetical protein
MWRGAVDTPSNIPVIVRAVEATLMSAEPPTSYLSLMIQVRYGPATKRLVNYVDLSQLHRRHAARRGAAEATRGRRRDHRAGRGPLRE